MTSTKRSLFSKPSWATSTSTSTSGLPANGATDDEAIFGRHGGKIYEDIIADELKRKEKRAARAKTREEASEGGRETKRRRVSDEREDDNETESDAGSSRGGDREERREVRAGPVTRSTPTKGKFTAGLDSPIKAAFVRTRQAEAEAILLGEGDDDLQITAAATVSQATKKATPQKPVGEDLESEPDSDDDDPYFRGLKLRAKQELALKEAEMAKKELALKQADIARNSPADPSTSMTDSTELMQESQPTPEGPLQKDEGPSVRIYITSIYPLTKPLIINQPASRSLKKVKEIWCRKQGFDEVKTKDFFLTWNGARLFDSSNLMTTLEALKRQRPDEDDPSGGNIHLEAMNPKIMEHRRQQKEREEAEAVGPIEQDGQHELVSEEPTQPAEKKIIISLQARDMDPFRLSVRPSTLIGKIMAGFQKQMRVEEGKVCWLVFDGNRLEPNTTVGEAEIEADDVVEVYVR